MECPSDLSNFLWPRSRPKHDPNVMCISSSVAAPERAASSLAAQDDPFAQGLFVGHESDLQKMEKTRRFSDIEVDLH
jgi:hypothetical protein